MKIIVGLGNPGKEYENTRHNIGYKVIDLYKHKLGVELNKKKFTGEFYKGEGFVLAKPHTFMNLSGNFVVKLMKYFKVGPEDLLVIYDDMDLPVGTIRTRAKGSSGGQKGMADIMLKLGTEQIQRLKIGIGRARNGAVNHVLGTFSKTQILELDKKKDEIIKVIDDFIKGE